MAKLNPINIGAITDLPTLIQYLNPFLQSLVSSANGQLTFKNNLATSQVTALFATAAVDIKISHQLNKTPTGYMVASTSGPAHIYNGSTLLFGPTFATLRCDTAGISASIMFY